MRVTAFIVLTISIAGAFFSSNCWSKMIISSNNDHYLPGDSLSALAIMIAQGADVVHLNLVMSADRQIVILSDTIINETTDAPEVFPEKARQNGSFHVIDFTMQELLQLSLVTNKETTRSTPRPHIRIATLSDALGLIQTMENNLDRRIEVVGEIKKSWQYLHADQDISEEVIRLCSEFGFTTKDSGFHIASYDPEELQRIHDDLFLNAGVTLSLLQLTEDNMGEETMRFERGKWVHYNYDWLFTKFGLKAVSGYVDMISLAPDFVISETGDLLHQEYIEDAHILGLKIIISPLDSLIEPSPEFDIRFETLLESYLITTGADGIITQNDQLSREFLKKQEQNSSGTHGKTTIELLLENVKRQQQIN